MTYSKRLTKSQRKTIKTVRRDTLRFAGDSEVLKSLSLAKRSADIKIVSK